MYLSRKRRFYLTSTKRKQKFLIIIMILIFYQTHFYLEIIDNYSENLFIIQK